MKPKNNIRFRDTVVGGHGVGDTVLCSSGISYCPACGRLLQKYEAKITGVRGKKDDGTMIYWVTYNCCGHKDSISETEILK